jgi:hypothetical protein
MPLVLVQNERTATEEYEHWKDVTGEQYHFPNQYKNRIVAGTPFVYYRGTRRAGGGRGTPEYFGCGMIGNVWRDDEFPESKPKRNWAWFCEINDYLPFKVPVSAKIGDEFIEKVPRNFWGVGVRELPADAHERILVFAGLAEIAQTKATPSVIMPAIDEVEIPSRLEERSLLLTQARSTRGKGGPERSTARYSRNAKQLGDRAEEIVFRYLSHQVGKIGGKDIRWVAREGATPGWDIQYIDANDEIVAVEVKGTSAAAFKNIELTEGEWNAARKLGGHFSLFLVTDCLGVSPKIQAVLNPAALANEGKLEVSPARWRLARPAATNGSVSSAIRRPNDGER